MEFLEERREPTPADLHVARLIVPASPEEGRIPLYVAGYLSVAAAVSERTNKMVANRHAGGGAVTHNFYAPLGNTPEGDDALLGIQYRLQDLWCIAIKRLVSVGLHDHYNDALTISWREGHPEAAGPIL